MKKTNNRNYNVFFNTHTVTGIIISVGLYICFFAGAFSLFMHNIDNWEANCKSEAYKPSIDYERVLSIAENEGYNLDGRTIFIRYRDGHTPYVQVNARPPKTKKDSTENTNSILTKRDSLAKASIFLKLDADTYKITARENSPETGSLGGFLYQLHYFGQIPNFGLYLSALVSLFFLFAIVTGTIVHWKKIVSNFFTFRLKGGIKNLWTDAHTALGIIGLPFQFMYAVTGALFGVVMLIFIPTVMLLYDGDQEKMTGSLIPGRKAFEMVNEPLAKRENINELVDKTFQYFGKGDLTNMIVTVSAYNDKNAHLTVNLNKKNIKGLFNDAYASYRLSDGEMIVSKGVSDNSYKTGVLIGLTNLHFANFGGYFIKAIYFILALITCFVILSGVMVWLEARNSKKYESKKKFNTNVGAVYLGASLGLFPAIALFFCITKIFPLEMEGRFSTMSTVFFLFWLAYIVYSFFIKDFHRTNKHALILAGVMGVTIPLLNGIQSGLWPWKSLSQGYIDSFFVDIIWFFLGMVSIYVGLKVKRLVSHKRKNNGKESTAEKVQDAAIATIGHKLLENEQ
ncbi:MAG: PepSY-associated TM helix domain-containing protein [Bacteroidota bacterium]